MQIQRWVRQDRRLRKPSSQGGLLQTTVDHLAKALAQGNGVEHQLLREAWGTGPGWGQAGWCRQEGDAWSIWAKEGSQTVLLQAMKQQTVSNTKRRARVETGLRGMQGQMFKSFVFILWENRNPSPFRTSPWQASLISFLRAATGSSHMLPLCVESSFPFPLQALYLTHS